jgi:hypothetical protein
MRSYGIHREPKSQNITTKNKSNKNASTLALAFFLLLILIKDFDLVV